MPSSFESRWLSRAKKEEQPLHFEVSFLAILLIVLAIVTIQVFAMERIVPEAHAEEVPSMTDRQIAETYQGETVEMCTKVLNHD